MSPEFWSIISVGIVILSAIGTANRATRREVNERMAEMRRELGGRIDELSERIGEVNERIAALRTEMIERIGEVNERIAAVRTEMSERFGEVNERIGRVEGLLEGIGYAQRKRAGKERGDREHGAVLPRP